MNSLQLRAYEADHDAHALLELLQAQGAEWACYSEPEAWLRYQAVLKASVCVVACEADRVVGYARALLDGDFYLYICDLLVDGSARGKGLGLALMRNLTQRYPNLTPYVMSDVDAYYEGLDFERHGSIFEVKFSNTKP
jgi:ribosomal protein S18 acetylase RimI-like enzyme